MVLSMAPLHSLGQDDQNKVQHNLLVMSSHCQQHHLTPMSSPMAHDTDARTGTSIGTKSHIIPLNNHLNMTNTMVSLMAASTSCDSTHAIAIYIPKNNMPSNAIHKSHMPITSGAHMRQLCQYICLIWT